MFDSVKYLLIVTFKLANFATLFAATKVRKMRIPSNKVQDIVRFAHSELDDVYGKEEVRAMVYRLLEHFAGLSFNKILSEPSMGVSESELLKIHFGIKDLKRNRPLQYIIGACDFLDTEILLSRKVLIPRPETEELTSIIIKENSLRSSLKIADLGCGSGCIAIALAKHLPNSEVYAFDISDDALAQTEENAAHNGVNINIRKADMKEGLPEKTFFDIIVSNPPYVMESEKSMMKPNVVEYEPYTALFVKDENPLEFYHSIASIAEYSLKENGEIYMETNEALCHETELIFTSLNYETQRGKDFFGKDRMLFARKKQTCTLPNR